MNSKSKITPAAVVAGAMLGVLVAPLTAWAEDVPDALSVEWQGKKPCEKLFEDAQVRIARCTFPPGVVHVCHSHPAYLSYVLSGGEGQVQDEKGTRKVDVVTGALLDVPPTPWHEFANVGSTTLQFLVVEKKYQPASPVSQTVCPKGTSK
jgi:quercetin dioxygenase-like cupin family protein